MEDICHAHQIRPATFYHWKQEAAIHNDEDKRLLRELEVQDCNLHRHYSLIGYLTPDEFEQLNRKFYFYPVTTYGKRTLPNGNNEKNRAICIIISQTWLKFADRIVFTKYNHIIYDR